MVLVGRSSCLSGACVRTTRRVGYSVMHNPYLCRPMAQKNTPLMRQYSQIKAKHPDTILLFRLGDFYETFGDDAIATAKACGITLTKRNNGGDAETPLAGFPHHQLDNYLPRLVRGGHRVAVCEQLEDPKQAKGIVRRDVVEVVTPGVVLYDKLLDHSRNTWVAAITVPVGKTDVAGLAYADVSTGMFVAGDVPMHMLRSVLESLAPAEVLVNKDHRHQLQPLVDSLPVTPAVCGIDSWHYDAEFTSTALLRHFSTTTLKGFGLDVTASGAVAAGVVLHYISQTQRTALSQITTLRRFRHEETMLLDAATRRNLEILSSNNEGGQGALVNVVDQTVTPMGARLLRSWLQTPLVSAVRIEKRLRVVRGLVHQASALAAIRQALRGMGDVERLITKVATNRATSRDLAALRAGFECLPTLRQALAAAASADVQALAPTIDLHEPLAQLLRRALADEPSLVAGSGGMFRQGYSAELDATVDALTNGKRWIAEYQERERESTGIPSLKVGSTGVFGYYIEITNAHRNRAPERYQRRQTLANAERYVTDELRDLETKIATAESRLVELETAALDDLRRQIAEHCAAVQATAQAVGVADTLASFANVAVENDYCEPVIHDGTDLVLRAARHPVIERVLPAGTSYVANDVLLDTAAAQIGIITGPNMSGKSSYLRQVGLITFLAHVGCFVPATEARIPLTDRIFTRVGAQDNLLAGESTFLVEMQEAANILNNATQRSLILLDEVGRGTATFDGISIAWAIAEYIHEAIGARTLFATHYHELTELAETFSRIFNLQVEVQEVAGSIVFTHRVVKGHSDHSFGIHVGRMAGLPRSVVASATRILAQLEEGHSVQGDAARAATVERQRMTAAGQISLFQVADDDLRERVRALDVNNLTPIQALQAITELKESLNE
jgi:DNA mismatch repair protein MutS